MMGQMQRRKRIMRELRGLAKPRSRVWPTVDAFDADACSHSPPLSPKEFAEKIAGLGLFVWYDQADRVIRATRYAWPPTAAKAAS